MSATGRLRLGVNIDHVATVRNARGGRLPDPVRAALLAEQAIERPLGSQEAVQRAVVGGNAVDRAARSKQSEERTIVG